MKKQVKVMLSLAMVAMLTLSMTVGTFAAAKEQKVSAVVNSTIKFKLNGVDWAPKDSKGVYYKALVYNGQVYLPVAAMSQDIAKLTYEYDARTKIVWIGGKTEILKVNVKALFNDWYGSMITSDKAKLSTADENYDWGVANDKPATMQTFGFYLKANGKYSHFRTSFFVDSSATKAVTFMIAKEKYNGEVIKEVVVEPGETVADVDVDITGVKELYIGADINIGHGTIDKIVVGEPIFYNGTLPEDVIR